MVPAATGNGLTPIALLTAVPTQLDALVSKTLTLPAPATPQSTVMLLVVVPDAWAPPVIVQA